MHFELTWRILLLAAVLTADLLVFLNLVAKELREVHADRTVAKGASEPTQRVRDAVRAHGVSASSRA